MVSQQELAILSGTSKEKGKCSLFLLVDGDQYLDSHSRPMAVESNAEKLHEERGAFAIAFEQETAFEVV